MGWFGGGRNNDNDTPSTRPGHLNPNNPAPSRPASPSRTTTEDPGHDSDADTQGPEHDPNNGNSGIWSQND